MSNIFRKQGVNTGGGGGSASDTKKVATYEESTALYNHAVNDLIVMETNNVKTLYKVTSAITVGDTITDEGQNANITDNTGIGADIQVYVNRIPSAIDGKTVTPTDDVQILLRCAGIKDKSYTTISRLLADTTTLQSVISSENAIDYLVRCKDWCGRALVPVMTSNTTPSGVCSASGEWSSTYPAYKAFDGNDYTGWISNNPQIGTYLQYEFPSARIVKSAVLLEGPGGDYRPFGDGKVQASSDASTWVDIYTFTSSSVQQKFDFQNSTAYKYWRIIKTSEGSVNVSVKTLQFYSGTYNLCDNSAFMHYVGLNNYASNTLLADEDWLNAIYDSTYFESVLNVKVPTMTSNTTPSGECFGNPTQQSGSFNYNFYASFDGDTSSQENGWYGTASGHYVGYKFENAVMAKIAYLVDIAIARSFTFKIQASNNGTDWSDISDTMNKSIDITSVTIPLNCETEYLYYRLIVQSITSSSSPYANVNELQFYGREDV